MRATYTVCLKCTLGVAIIGIYLFVGREAYSQTANAQALHDRFIQLYRAGKYGEAIPVAKKYAEAIKTQQGEKHNEYANALSNLAFLYDKNGQYEEALPLYERALAMKEEALGPNHPDVGTVLNNLGMLIGRQGRNAEAVALYRRSLAIREKALGKNHPHVAHSLSNLALVYEDQGKYDEAEPLHKRSLAIKEKVFGRDHSDVAAGLINLAGFYQVQGQYEQAERLIKRALPIWEKALGKNHPRFATGLVHLASVYKDQGRYGLAEPILKRAAAIQEKALGKNHVEFGVTLNSLGLLYKSLGRYGQAESLTKRAIAIWEKAHGKNHAIFATGLNNLAELYRAQKHYDQAEPLYKRALAVSEKLLGANHPDVADTLNSLAVLYNEQGQYDEAEPLLRRSLAIKEITFGKDNLTVAASLNNLATVYRAQKRYGQAELLYKRAIAIWEKAHGKSHPRVATALRNLGLLQKDNLRLASAYGYLRRAASILESRALSGIARRRNLTVTADNQDTSVFRILARTAWQLAEEKPKQRVEFAGATYRDAQWVGRTSTHAALSQMAARLGTGDAKLARQIRTHQDLQHQWQILDEKLIKVLGAPSRKSNENEIKQLKATAVAAKKRLTKLTVQIDKDFPEYAELSNPRPLEIAQIRRLLSREEALVLYLVNSEETYVWVVTSDDMAWRRIDRKKADLQGEIAAIRKSLDPISALKGKGRGFTREQVCRGLARQNNACDAYDTDLARAYRLYQMLLGPLERTIKNKRNLIVVPSGPLTGLPFHMLLTEPPPIGGRIEQRFKRAKWLIRRHAVTVLPSVSSLRALREFARKGQAKRPFIGFGDPDFLRPSDKPKTRTGVGTIQDRRGYAAYFRGELADVDMLSGSIPQLPDTADELRAVGKVLKANKSEIVLGREASETTIKALSATGQLSDYRIVHFATHGLVAGEIKGLAEPALALSLPSTATDKDDGLLTASEVAQLKINAEWVVLSACNTAAGDKPGAEALSGLARAFFYSGARALLVSHWPVVSSAAVKLTTRAFAELKSNPKIGKAEALRRSMLRLIDKGTAQEAHPAYWAPFIVVGEGAR